MTVKLGRWLLPAVVIAGAFASAPTASAGRPSAAARAGSAKVAPAIAVAIGGVAALAPRDPAQAQTPAERAAVKIEALYRGPLRHGNTSVFVVDATTGQPLFAVDPDRPMNPASNVKLLSTAAALDLLGPDHRYRTRVLGATPDAEGVVRGGLYLHGTYDPTLDAGDVRGLGSALASLGLRRVEGDIVVGETPTRDGIYRASLAVELVAGRPGKPAVARLPASYAGYELVEIDVTRTRTRGRGRARLTFKQQLVTTEAGHTRLRLIVTGTVGRGRSTTHRIAFDSLRAIHTAHLLRAGLRSAGVELTGDVRVAELDAFVADATPAALPVALAQHDSEALATLVARINKRSINWLSDRVIMTAAAARYHEKPSMRGAVRAMHEWLARRTDLDPSAVVVDTGSGLSYNTEFSARHIVSVLRRAGGFTQHAAADDALARAYLDSLAVAGVDGTLRHRFSSGEVRGHLRGKTGTLRTSIALSGILEVDPSRPLAFAIVTNDHRSRQRYGVRRAHEDLIVAVCEYLHASRGEPGAAGAQDSVEVGPRAALDDASDRSDDETDLAELAPAGV